VYVCPSRWIAAAQSAVLRQGSNWNRPCYHAADVFLQGFYRSGQLNQYDRYSNTNDVTVMVNDQVGWYHMEKPLLMPRQLTKMRAQRTTPEGRFFVCSFTLTQNAVQASTCFLGTASSILELSAKANPALFTMLWPNCTSATYPNVLYIDGLDSSIYAALAMGINSLLVCHTPCAIRCCSHI